MLNVCANCGAYRADKIIDANGPVARCPLCHWPHPFRRLPIFFLCGPSGGGKSAICQALAGAFDECVVLDGDILWRPEFNSPADNYRDFYETWLRLAKNIGQSGRPVVICNAGSIPANIEGCVERRYFARSHYLAPVCDDDILRRRLVERPVWRESSAPSFLESQIDFNRWLKREGSGQTPPIALLDTSTATIAESTAQAIEWIRRGLTEERSNKNGGL